MAVDRSEFRGVSRYIRDLLSHSDTQKYTDPVQQAASDALRQIFSAESTNPASAGDVLDTWNDQAPLTFGLQWPPVKAGLERWETDSSRALRLLGRLLGWAYIESSWNATRNNTAQFGGGPAMAVLAATYLGLDLKSSDLDVKQAIYTHSALLSELLLRRFETEVKGGLGQIHETKETIEGRISSWEERVGKAEARASASEEKISNYDKAIQKYKVQFGILLLTQAFREFFGRKRLERNIWLGVVIVLGALILAVPSATFLLGSTGTQPTIAAKTAPATNENNLRPAGKTPVATSISQSEARTPNTTNAVTGVPQETWQTRVERYLPLALLLLLLIYFFRVALMHFNSTQVQLLQLEMKIAACAFIEEYVKFSKESGTPNLEKFESLVFGGVVAETDKIPSTFDPLHDLLRTLRSERKKE